MVSILQIASIALFFIVGVICLSMAYTTTFSKKYLPFHEQGAGMKWEEHGPGLQATILTLLQLSGLGFLVVGLMIVALPILNRFDHSLVLAVSVPILALVFCVGLAYFQANCRPYHLIRGSYMATCHSYHLTRRSYVATCRAYRLNRGLLRGYLPLLPPHPPLLRGHLPLLPPHPRLLPGCLPFRAFILANEARGQEEKRLRPGSTPGRF